MHLKLYSYNNFDIDVNGDTFLIIVWALCAGLLLGVAVSLMTRSLAHGITKAFIDAGASDRSSAKTLAQAGLKNTFAVRYMLREYGALRKYIFTAKDDGEGNPTAEADTEADDTESESGKKRRYSEKKRYEAERMYLPEEKRIGAELRFTEEKRPMRTFLMALILFVAAGFLITTVLPELLTMFDNLLTQLTPESRFY